MTLIKITIGWIHGKDNMQMITNQRLESLPDALFFSRGCSSSIRTRAHDIPGAIVHVLHLGTIQESRH
jgi:hypothetical protein